MTCNVDAIQSYSSASVFDEFALVASPILRGTELPCESDDPRTTL
jgi:hypothetical protein